MSDHIRVRAGTRDIKVLNTKGSLIQTFEMTSTPTDSPQFKTWGNYGEDSQMSRSEVFEMISGIETEIAIRVSRQ